MKIADFGSSELMGYDHCDPIAGTTRYKAPEQFNQGAINLLPDKMDVYSFGCVCFKLLTGDDPPFKNQFQLRERFLTCDRNLPGVVEVVKNCLDINPGARPDFRQICGDLDPVLELGSCQSHLTYLHNLKK